MTFDQALEAALDGDAIMFAGAGFSSGATNLQNKPFLRGSELAEKLAAATKLPDDTKLDEAAEVYVDDIGPDKLIDLLQIQFTALDVARHHKTIVAIPWRAIYTTNYDNVIEKASEAEGKRCTPITTSVNIRDIPKDHMLCIHLNGYIHRLNRDTLQNELKLTDSSYLTASLTNSPWWSYFRQEMRFARAIFFIGYSLYDVDVRKLLFESEILKEKCFFVLPNPKPALKRRVDKFGTLISAPGDEFAKLAKKKTANYTPAKHDITTLSLKEWSVNTPSSISLHITDKDFWSLLLYGNFQEACIDESLRNAKTYYLNRSNLDKAMAFLRDNKIIAVCSDLGNGKTMFTRGIVRKALSDGYKVFEVAEKTELAIAELIRVASSTEKTLIIIDGYQAWISEIETFFQHASNNVRMLVTARNTLHEVLVDDLCTAVGLTSVKDLRLDIMKQDECEWFVKALNEYGLWGERAGFNPQRKLNFITQTCHSQVHALLLKILESPDIHNKLCVLSNDLAKKTDTYNVILSVFMFAAINSPATLDMLADIWGADMIGNSAFRNNSNVRQLIDFSLDRISVRSATAAQYFLSKVASTSITVSALISMVKRVDELAITMERHRSLIGELMRIRHLQNILPQDGRTAAIFHFYESTKNLNNTRSNPLFWLQYAIAALSAKDLARARQYFDTSYSLARSQPWFRTYQIDNHFARYLLISAIENLTLIKAMENFRLARQIINQQIQDEKHYNPYRVAIEYRAFIDRFGSNLSIQNVQEIGEAAKVVNERSFRLPSSVKNHRWVIECRKAMDYVQAQVVEREKTNAKRRLSP